MDTQKVTKEYRITQWTKIIQDRLDSGLNVKKFCQAAGISKDAYFYWQRKLRETACEALVKSEGQKEAVPGGWMQLAPLQTQDAPTALDIEISRCHVKVFTDTDPELLKKVCRILISL